MHKINKSPEYYAKKRVNKKLIDTNYFLILLVYYIWTFALDNVCCQFHVNYDTPATLLTTELGKELFIPRATNILAHDIPVQLL